MKAPASTTVPPLGMYDQGADDNVDVIIAKNRDGGDGIATLFFDGPGTRMTDWPIAVPTFNQSLPSPNNRIEPEDQPF